MGNNLPEWAEPPGPGWEHRGNYSNVDVVWYNGDQVVYQTQDGYGAPAPAPVTIIREPEPKPKSLARRVILVSAVVSAVVAALVPHIHF